MITFKQDGSSLTPYWTDGRPVSEKDWAKISRAVKRGFKPTTEIAVVNKLEVVTAQERQLTDMLYAKLRENFDFLVAKPTPDKEYLEMNKLHRIDGRDYQLIAVIIQWSQQHHFWKQNIRSVAKLRKQFETLMIQAQADIKTAQSRTVSV